MPWVLIFVTAMLDTVVLPLFFRGPYVVPLTWICVMCIALLMGRMPGILYGFWGGFLLDVIGGSLGERLIALILIGYLLGLIVYESDPRRLREISRRKMLIRRAVYSTVFSMAAEGVICFYQYFHTARFEWIYLLNCAIRSCILGACTLLLLPVVGRIVLGKGRRKEKRSRVREVKSF